MIVKQKAVREMLKNNFEGFRISKDAIEKIDEITSDFVYELLRYGIKCAKKDKRKTISTHDLEKFDIEIKTFIERLYEK